MDFTVESYKHVLQTVRTNILIPLHYVEQPFLQYAPMLQTFYTHDWPVVEKVALISVWWSFSRDNPFWYVLSPAGLLPSACSLVCSLWLILYYKIQC